MLAAAAAATLTVASQGLPRITQATPIRTHFRTSQTNAKTFTTRWPASLALGKQGNAPAELCIRKAFCSFS
jgi:hypothetical protein